MLKLLRFKAFLAVPVRQTNGSAEHAAGRRAHPNAEVDLSDGTR